MQNPIASIIDRAVHYVQQKDPSWEHAQPADFKVRVVENWKEQIQGRLETNCRISWELPLGDQTFRFRAPIFCTLDWNYNPYLLGMHEPHFLKKIQ